MGKIDLIIFDCDGVLIDSELISCECAMLALRSAGMQIDLETVLRRYLGTSRREMAQQVAALGYEVGEDFTERLETAVSKAFEERLNGIPGVRRALSQMNIPRCVASNSEPSYISRGLELAGLADLFDDNVFSASMVSQGKPAPDLFLYAAKRMGVPPGRCLVIEDSFVGVRAANAAGMPVFWFLGGSHINTVRHPLDSHFPLSVMQFERMEQLPELIRLYSEQN